MSEPLHRHGAVALARALATRELKAATLAAALAERCTAREADVQAWVDCDAAAALGRARVLDRGAVRGALHGLPLAVKDNIDTAGVPTAYGSPVYAGHLPAVDAACVALARAAGAWVQGKTVCTEFANMTPGATRNPWHPAHTPGGSSSGSAAAVACGMTPWALGTQTAGSVIRPAAYCGIVGYKPTPRRIPRAGTKANSDTLDEVGVLARSVADAALLARVLSGAASAAAAPLQSPKSYRPRIGVTLTSRPQALSPDMVRMVHAVAARLSAAGAAVFDAPWPARLDTLFDAQRTVQLFETARALAPELQYRRTQLSPGLQALLDEGGRIDAAVYARALQQAAAARGMLDKLFGSAELLMTPAAPGAAPRSLQSTGDPLFNRPWQLLGCPSIALPGELSGDGLPLGLQFVGRPGDDERVFAAAAWAFEALDAQAITQACCQR